MRWLWLLALLGCGVPRGAIDGADGGESDASMDAALDVSFDAPILDAPILDAPILDAPILDAPILDAPILDAPILDAPMDAGADAPVDVGPDVFDAGMDASECVPGTMTSCGPCDDGIQTCTPEGMIGTCEGASLPNTWYVDADGDGYGFGAAMTDCDPAMGRVDNDDDCNDACFDCNPLGTEVCDGLDNDCNLVVDEGVTTDYWVDADGDGYGDGTMLMNGCGGPGLVDNPDDCNDACPHCYPGFAFELCDGLDNDCNTTVDEDCDDCFVESTPTNGDYVICDFALGSWAAGRNFCRAAGWEMVIIDDATENAEVWALLDPYDRDFWNGGVEGSGNDWFWVDGSALATDCTSGGCTCVSYCNWLSGQPNSAFADDCTYFPTDGAGQWADSWCNDNRAFVCEVP